MSWPVSNCRRPKETQPWLDWAARRGGAVVSPRSRQQQPRQPGTAAWRTSAFPSALLLLCEAPFTSWRTSSDSSLAWLRRRQCGQPVSQQPRGAMPRVAIIDCDAASPDEDFNGRNVARWLLDPGDGDAGWSFTHVRPKVPGELPRSVDAFDGYVIPGSRSMVTEREGWMEEVEALIRAANAKGKPLVGMCFGHQIIGRALGGTVAPVAVNGEKMNNAVDEIVLTAEAAPYGLSGETSASGSLRLMKGHEQQLVELPPDSTLLGSSTSTAIEVWSNASGNVLC
jgi:GMP synthase-like glutamine amidotransferase